MNIRAFSLAAVVLCAGVARADFVVNFSTSYYSRSGLANNGLPGATPDGTPDPANQANDATKDFLGLTATSGTLHLVAGVPQTASINLVSFIAGITGAGTAGDYPGDGNNGGLDHNSDPRGAFITDQTLTVNGNSQVIAQSFTLNVGWQYDTLTLHESPSLTFDLGDGNILTFRALAGDPFYSGGDESNGTTAGEFLLTTVPLPPAAYAGLGSLVGVAGLGVLRRRRHFAA